LVQQITRSKRSLPLHKLPPRLIAHNKAMEMRKRRTKFALILLVACILVMLIMSVVIYFAPYCPNLIFSITFK
jgi:hypothetical protein